MPAIRCAAIAVVLVFVSCLVGLGQQQADLPKAPEPLNAVAVHTFDGVSRHSIMLAADQKSLMTSKAGILRVWDLATGQMVRKVEDPLFRGAITPTPDAKLWLRHPFSVDESLILIDPVTYKEVLKFEDSVRKGNVLFSPNGKQLFAIDFTKGNLTDIWIWDVQSGKRIHPTPFDNWKLRCLYVVASPDGTRYLIATPSELLFVDSKTGRRHPIPAGLNTDWGRTAFSPDGRTLAASYRSLNRIDLIDTADGSLIEQIEWQIEEVTLGTNPPRRDGGLDRVEFSPDGKTLLVSGECDRRLTVIEVATRQIRYRIDAKGCNFCLLPFPQGFRIVTSSFGDRFPIRIWDRMNPQQSREESSEQQLCDLFGDIESGNAVVAWKAMRRYHTNPKLAVRILADKVQSIMSANEATTSDLIRKLDDDDFDTRDDAEERLRSMEKAAEKSLRGFNQTKLTLEARQRIKRLLDGLESPQNSIRLRSLRVTELLESIGSEEAITLLKQYARGGSGATLTEESNATLRRMNQ